MSLRRRAPSRELTPRHKEVLEAVVRTFVETAAPTGSVLLGRRYDFGVSPATIRNTMADLESMGYLSHPHTSAGRVPTDLAYRYFVDEVVRAPIVDKEKREIEAVLASGSPSVHQVIRNATHALGVIVKELGIGNVPLLEEATLERIDLLRVSSERLLMAVALTGGMVRTVVVDLPGSAPAETLFSIEAVLNERLAGRTFAEIKKTFGKRLQDSLDDPRGRRILNFIVERKDDLFNDMLGDSGQVVLGNTSPLAAKPEFSSHQRLNALIRLTESTELLERILGQRASRSGINITIGGSEHHEDLAGLTLVTSRYRIGKLSGVIGVMGPTRMPYEKVIALVEHTSKLIDRMLDA